VNKTILKSAKTKKTKNLRVLMIWLPVLGSDTRASAVKAMSAIRDSRVVHVWDGKAIVSKWFHQHMLPLTNAKFKAKRLFRKGLVWDAYFLWGPKAQWAEKGPSRPGTFGATILRARAGLSKALGVKSGKPAANN